MNLLEKIDLIIGNLSLSRDDLEDTIKDIENIRLTLIDRKAEIGKRLKKIDDTIDELCDIRNEVEDEMNKVPMGDENDHHKDLEKDLI